MREETGGDVCFGVESGIAELCGLICGEEVSISSFLPVLSSSSMMELLSPMRICLATDGDGRMFDCEWCS